MAPKNLVFWRNWQFLRPYVVMVRKGRRVSSSVKKFHDLDAAIRYAQSLEYGDVFIDDSSLDEFGGYTIWAREFYEIFALGRRHKYRSLKTFRHSEDAVRYAETLNDLPDVYVAQVFPVPDYSDDPARIRMERFRIWEKMEGRVTSRQDPLPKMKRRLRPGTPSMGSTAGALRSPRRRGGG